MQLPIDPLLPEILQTIERNMLTLLDAEPGAGKTTRVPAALCIATRRPVFVLEPRRLAARLAARRVAEELASPLGQTVGYQVRFEKIGGPGTRLWYLTEGVLTKRLLSGQPLPQNTVVILDEFHERHVETDLALALLRRLLPERSDIRVLLMSATLGAEALAAQLDPGVPIIKAPGRAFPLSITHLPASAEKLEDQAAAAVRRLLAETNGHVLVFLPGAAEIRNTLRACEPLARSSGVRLLALHGDLSADEQDAAVRRSEVRKIICSTNVAESSVTIDGVTAVVDSGLARVMTFPTGCSGIGRLEVSKVSRASCMQRAGRAGRTGPGLVIRLYSHEDFVRRPETAAVEIARADLAQLALQAAAAGLDCAELPWLDAPPASALASALGLLQDLGATGEDGRATSDGLLMGDAPVHPRLSALVLKASAWGNPEEACKLAALLSEGRTRLPETSRNRFPSDIDALLSSELSFSGRKLQSQLVGLSRRVAKSPDAEAHALERATLFAFRDRAGKRRGETLLLASGASARLDRHSCTTAEFCVAVEMDDRSDASLPLVRIASPIEPDWLLDLFPEDIETSDELAWNREEQRVEQAQLLRYRRLTIVETRARPAAGTERSSEVKQMLVDKAIDLGLESWRAQPEVDRLLARVDFAVAHGSPLDKSEALLRSALDRMAEDLVSISELREGQKNGALLSLLQAMASPKILDEVAPASISLPTGRRARIDYTPGKLPSVASRLQDFIGLKESPSVARGRVPLVLQILAPNGRPVQVTTDLASFWKNLYPQLRRELSRRYPKHSWPETPA